MEPEIGLVVAVQRTQTGADVHRLNNLLQRYVLACYAENAALAACAKDELVATLIDRERTKAGRCPRIPPRRGRASLPAATSAWSACAARFRPMKWPVFIGATATFTVSTAMLCNLGHSLLLSPPNGVLVASSGLSAAVTAASVWAALSGKKSARREKELPQSPSTYFLKSCGSQGAHQPTD